MIDYNIFGMGDIWFDALEEREGMFIVCDRRYFLIFSKKSNITSGPSSGNPLEKQTFAQKEFDTTAACIINRTLVKQRDPNTYVDNGEKLVSSLGDIWRAEEARRAEKGLPFPYPLPDSLSNRISSGAPEVNGDFTEVRSV